MAGNPEDMFPRNKQHFRGSKKEGIPVQTSTHLTWLTPSELILPLNTVEHDTHSSCMSEIEHDTHSSSSSTLDHDTHSS